MTSLILLCVKDRESSPWSEDHIRINYENGEAVLDPNVGLKELAEWLKQERGLLPNYDHAIGYTWYARP